MIIAGFGCRKGVSEAEVGAALHGALAMAKRDRMTVDCIAIPHFKTDETGLCLFIQTLGCSLKIINQAALEQGCDRAQTHSARVASHVGVSSVAESAALAAAGPEGYLIVPRFTVGPVTCAIAIGDSLI
jgi:cobalt-precorrin 5A hydrolase